MNIVYGIESNLDLFSVYHFDRNNNKIIDYNGSLDGCDFYIKMYLI
jgi:hypothetical protein